MVGYPFVVCDRLPFDSGEGGKDSTGGSFDVGPWFFVVVGGFVRKVARRSSLEGTASRRLGGLEGWRLRGLERRASHNNHLGSISSPYHFSARWYPVELYRRKLWN